MAELPPRALFLRFYRHTQKVFPFAVLRRGNNKAFNFLASKCLTNLRSKYSLLPLYISLRRQLLLLSTVSSLRYEEDADCVAEYVVNQNGAR